MSSKDMDKFYLIWQFYFRLEPIRATAPSTSKNITQFKSGQKWLKNNHFATFTKFCIKSIISFYSNVFLSKILFIFLCVFAYKYLVNVFVSAHTLFSLLPL